MTERPSAADELTPIVVVTGGSDGIGKAIARRLVEDGKVVLLVARELNRLEVTARELQELKAGRVEWLALDITKPEAAATISATLGHLGGRMDLLVNNAGTGLSGEFTEHSPEAIAGLLALNVAALTMLLRHFLPELRARRAGGVINIASLGGYVPGPNQAAYYASKAYVISLSEAVAAEVARDGVRVTVVNPGPVNTGFHAKMGAEGAIYRRWLPALSADAVARRALLAYRLGLRSVTPGVINSCMMLFLRILPHRIVIPIIQWLLRPATRGK